MRDADFDRTRALASQWGRWILPHWMERQLDPSSPAWEPDTGDGRLCNVAARDVAPVGTIGAPQVAVVDPRGLVTPWPGGWSLDWWVGADDRWHVPAREITVRQRVVDGAPVVETAMRVPGGDIVETVWAFADPDAGPVLAVEMRHEGRVPVAVSLAVRPYGIDGAHPIDEIAVDGRGIVVDGRRAVWLPKPAARLAASSWERGDVATAVFGGDASAVDDVTVTCRHGLAQAAAVLPLSHGTSFVVLIPLDPDGVAAGDPAPEVVPPADAVARGWASHRSRAARVVIPDAEIAETLDAAVAQVMLAAAGARLDTAGVRDVASITSALDRLGLRDEVDPVIAGIPDGQRQGGELGGDDDDDAATGAVLVAAGTHWALGREDALVDALAGPLAAGAHHRPGSGRLIRKGSPLGADASAWQLVGSRKVAAALRAVGQGDAAAAVDGSVADLRATVESGRATLDPIDTLELMWLGAVDVLGDEATAVLERLRSTSVHDGGVMTASGVSPVHTARLGSVELRRGEREALDRVRQVVDAAGPERSWPGRIHPRTGAGVAGASWSAAAAAAAADLVLDLLCLVDAERSEVRFLPVVSPEWFGAGVEAHGLCTELGVVSFAVRWHGERPALLWEVEPHPGVGPLTITAPGLDPEWSSSDAKGEALLDAPRPVELALPVDAAPEDVAHDTTQRDVPVDPPEVPGPPPEGPSFS